MPVSKHRRKNRRRKPKRRGPTPPKHPEATKVDVQGPSPTWYVVLMFGLMAVGFLVILLNYMGLMPGSPRNTYLVAGLVGIAVGFAMTLNYR